MWNICMPPSQHCSWQACDDVQSSHRDDTCISNAVWHTSRVRHYTVSCFLYMQFCTELMHTM